MSLPPISKFLKGSPNPQFESICKRGLRVGGGHEGGALMLRLVPSLEEEEERNTVLSLRTHTEVKSCKDTARRQPSAYQEESSHQNLTILAP